MLDLFYSEFAKHYCDNARTSYDILHALAKKYEWGLASNDLKGHWGVYQEVTGTSQYSPWDNHYSLEVIARTARDDPITIHVKYLPYAQKSRAVDKAEIKIIRCVPSYDWMSEVYHAQVSPANAESAIDAWVDEIARGQPPSNTKLDRGQTQRVNLN